MSLSSLRHGFAAVIDFGFRLVHADAQVVILFVGEIRADVAGGAVALVAEEDLAAALGAVRHRMLFGRFLVGQIFLRTARDRRLSVHRIDVGQRPQLLVVVERRRAGDQRPLEPGDRLGHGVDRQLAEDVVELQL